MGKQKLQFNQGFIISFAGVISWYLISTAIYIPLGRITIQAGPGALALFPLLILLLLANPVGILLLFILGQRFAFSHWFGWGILAAYLINIIASYLFPPFLSAYLVKIGFYNIPSGELISPNGGLNGLLGLPFFLFL